MNDEYIIIGADELILWLRKNGRVIAIPNDQINGLGRRIYDIIINLNGEKINDDVPSFWSVETGSKNIGEFLLPKTSAQYRIPISRFNELYRELNLL